MELAVESQPTLQFSWGGYDMMTIPLLVISSSWTFGSPSFRAGPMISGGLLTYGAGARALYQPFQRRNGKRHGLDLRLNWWGYVTGELTMLYTREL